MVSATTATPRSVTITLRPNSAWQGFTAGQSIPIGIDVDGVRRTRTYSPACSQHRHGDLLELTVTTHPEGLVSRHLRENLRPGAILHLGAAQGEFVLPEKRPRRLVLISGGSGVTPVLSMLRTLCDEGHDGEVHFLHYARTEADWLYRPEVRRLASEHPGVHVHYVATREGGRHIDAQSISELLQAPPGEATAAVCGPNELIEAVREIWCEAPDRVIAESFAPPPLVLPDTAVDGTIRFLRSDCDVEIGDGTLLEQAEAAGLSPDFGCRMGICHTCTCHMRAGAVRNLRSGEILAEEQDIQLCVSVPAGDVDLEL